jgi:hypothetical protein
MPHDRSHDKNIYVSDIDEQYTNELTGWVHKRDFTDVAELANRQTYK